VLSEVEQIRARETQLNESLSQKVEHELKRINRELEYELTAKVIREMQGIFEL
jgi:hypothetical protein